VAKSDLPRIFDGPWSALDHARDLNIADLLARSAQRLPDATALVYGEQRFTYEELDAAVKRVAAQLDHAGVRRGHFVVTLARNSANLVILYFALSYLGAINVPLNPMLTAPEVTELVERTLPVSFIYSEEFRPVAEAVEAAGFSVWHLPEGVSDSKVDSLFDVYRGEQFAGGAATGGCRPAIVIYTSGSTARPKGCVKSHSNILWHVINRQLMWPLTEQDKQYFCVPVSGVGFTNFVVPTFASGATLVLDRVDPRTSPAVMEEERVTTTFLPATVVQAFFLDEKARQRDLSSLRQVILSYRMTAGVRRKLVEAYGEIFIYGYGMTEGAMLNGYPATFEAKPTSHGIPNGVDEVMIADQDGRRCPVGQQGEILIKGPTVMLGYLDDPRATEDALRNGWLHSGDVGYIDEEGHLHFVGRFKDMIKTGGYNVASEEVERAIVNLSQIADVAVIGVPDDRWGEAVRAIVVPEVAGIWTEDRLLTELRKSLAGFKCPKSVVFVDALPRNPGGKLAKGMIEQIYGENYVHRAQDA
jgi:fatty-acyl-CoA synthase